jgi:hypothetical protein
MYLIDANLDIFFKVSTLSQFLLEAKEVPMGGNEAWYSWI